MPRALAAMILATVAMLTLGLSTAASGPTSPVSVSFPPSLTIVAFGMSSSRGARTSGATAYATQIETLLRRAMPKGRSVTVIDRDKSGDVAADVGRRLASDVMGRRPDIVIWQTDSAEAGHVSLVRFERETREGIEELHRAGIAVILMEPKWCSRPDTIGPTRAYRDTVRRIGADMHVAVIHRWDLMHRWVKAGLLSRRDMLAADGVNMNDQGYALLARWVASEILKTKVFRPASASST